MLRQIVCVLTLKSPSTRLLDVEAAVLMGTDSPDGNSLQIAPYFSKVECFCFEEQKLLAGEEVDMPLLFFIDKAFLDDPACRNVDDIVLSYTFFRWETLLPSFLLRGC
jgi:cytochrome c oxidase assembly protein Cox11